MTERDESLPSLLSRLQQQRDELALQVHLGKAEAKEEWDKYERRLRELLDEYEPVRDVLEETADNVLSGLWLTAEEVKAGFQRVRKLL